jgi:hypothetical protein
MRVCIISMLFVTGISCWRGVVEIQEMMMLYVNVHVTIYKYVGRARECPSHNIQI